MKIAFLFLTRGDVNQPKLWDAFIDGVPKEEYSVYCHPKFQRSLVSKMLKGKAIPPQIETKHGHISLVSATILLMQEAIKDPENTHFILLSESCIPLYTFSGLKDRLITIGKSVFGYQDLRDLETENRYNAMTVPDFLTRDQFFKQSQWMCLHREAVELILSVDYVNIFQKVYAPDEHYFISVLVKEGYPMDEKVENNYMTFVNWTEAVRRFIPQTIKDGEILYSSEIRPKTYHQISTDQLEAARRHGFLFFRKVSEDCVFAM
jgi:hypothetical protein